MSSIILSSNKIQNGYILAPANAGPPGKCPLKRRDSQDAWLVPSCGHGFKFHSQPLRTNDNDFIAYCSLEAKLIHAQTKAIET